MAQIKQTFIFQLCKYFILLLLVGRGFHLGIHLWSQGMWSCDLRGIIRNRQMEIGQTTVFNAIIIQCSQLNVFLIFGQFEDVILYKYICGSIQSVSLRYLIRENLMFLVRAKGIHKKDHISHNLWERPRNGMSPWIAFYCLKTSNQAYPNTWKGWKQCPSVKEEKKTLSSSYYRGKTDVHNGTELLKFLRGLQK